MTNRGNLNRRDLGKTRKHILDAAAREFSKHGLSGARVDSIAKLAGANKAMIYYIFGGKEDLHLAVLESLFEEKTKNLDNDITSQNLTRETFFIMLRNYFEAFLERKDYAQILLSDMATGGKALRRLYKKRPDLFKVFQQISTMVDESAQRGLLRGIDADKGVALLILLITSLACSFPLTDLLRLRGSVEHKNLSDPGQWEIFLADLLQRILFQQAPA
jgi:AcrR family transcriptional regulator